MSDEDAVVPEIRQSDEEISHEGLIQEAVDPSRNADDLELEEVEAAEEGDEEEEEEVEEGLDESEEESGDESERASESSEEEDEDPVDSEAASSNESLPPTTGMLLFSMRERRSRLTNIPIDQLSSTWSGPSEDQEVPIRHMKGLKRVAKLKMPIARLVPGELSNSSMESEKEGTSLSLDSDAVTKITNITGVASDSSSTSEIPSSSEEDIEEDKPSSVDDQHSSESNTFAKNDKMHSCTQTEDTTFKGPGAPKTSSSLVLLNPSCSSVSTNASFQNTKLESELQENSNSSNSQLGHLQDLEHQYSDDKDSKIQKDALEGSYDVVGTILRKNDTYHKSSSPSDSSSKSSSPSDASSNLSSPSPSSDVCASKTSPGKIITPDPLQDLDPPKMKKTRKSSQSILWHKAVQKRAKARRLLQAVNKAETEKAGYRKSSAEKRAVTFSEINFGASTSTTDPLPEDEIKTSEVEQNKFKPRKRKQEYHEIVSYENKRFQVTNPLSSGPSGADNTALDSSRSKPSIHKIEVPKYSKKRKRDSELSDDDIPKAKFLKPTPPGSDDTSQSELNIHETETVATEYSTKVSSETFQSSISHSEEIRTSEEDSQVKESIEDSEVKPLIKLIPVEEPQNPEENIASCSSDNKEASSDDGKPISAQSTKQSSSPENSQS